MTMADSVSFYMKLSIVIKIVKPDIVDTCRNGETVDYCWACILPVKSDFRMITAYKLGSPNGI